MNGHLEHSDHKTYEYEKEILRRSFNSSPIIHYVEVGDDASDEESDATDLKKMNVWSGKLGRPEKGNWTGVKNTVIFILSMKGLPEMRWKQTRDEACGKLLFIWKRITRSGRSGWSLVTFPP